MRIQFILLFENAIHFLAVELLKSISKRSSVELHSHLVSSFEKHGKYIIII